MTQHQKTSISKQWWSRKQDRVGTGTPVPAFGVVPTLWNPKLSNQQTFWSKLVLASFGIFQLHKDPRRGFKGILHAGKLTLLSFCILPACIFQYLTILLVTIITIRRLSSHCGTLSFFLLFLAQRISATNGKSSNCHINKRSKLSTITSEKRITAQ